MRTLRDSWLSPFMCNTQSRLYNNSISSIQAHKTSPFSFIFSIKHQRCWSFHYALGGILVFFYEIDVMRTQHWLCNGQESEGDIRTCWVVGAGAELKLSLASSGSVASPALSQSRLWPPDLAPAPVWPPCLGCQWVSLDGAPLHISKYFMSRVKPGPGLGYYKNERWRPTHRWKKIFTNSPSTLILIQ